MESDVIRTLLVYALPVLFAITLHEAAHGYVARHYGDPTAEQAGRISLNPIRHIDPIGTVLMPLLLYVATSGAFVFGYAKPVPVDWRQLRHPKRDMVWVAFAGPCANLLQAVGWAVFGAVLLGLGIDEEFFLLMARAGVLVNLVMFAFNLVPVPPLDGGRILVGLLPVRLALPVARLEPYGFFIVMGLVLVGVVSTYWMLPIMAALLQMLSAALPSLPTLIGLQ
ncbi:site-2 protease family protein [Methylibium rhizosphaerae]|uniref:site-2 protease family protein n=1 Tax=Methylibium rhizosphaerae TaxID=2570323 RepID=UPI001FE3C9C8|nr:site-2 protease family protein [Methylibium rhizosphaerae]